ncbi:hypothetical protein [Anaerotignum sp.]|uniref:hypothetical protein n=1 Tax=Anaerotignum sp. TaxID=2039241 RepID=UPI0028A19E62|nr:hypothetical protein [Anaerotignum sp.]
MTLWISITFLFCVLDSGQIFALSFFREVTRLLELADSISELKTICACGKKATVNARLDQGGNVITQGEQVYLGGHESYRPMCYRCWKKAIHKETEK